MALPDSFIQELLSKNDIESVASEYVAFKRRGRNLVGLCPFHGEKTASFNLYPETNSFYCFGCGAGGDVITFVKRIQNLDYMDAVRHLADRCGMKMPEQSRENDQVSRLRMRILEANREAARIFHAALYRPEGQVALEYYHRRGYTDATIKHFGLGFAPQSWDYLLTRLREKGFKDEELIAAFLAARGRNGGIYDVYRNRVIIPIIDIRGNVVGFGGRVLDDSKPKYLNSPETLIFNKRKNLFGLNLAKKSKLGYLILVEGYMDAIALHQYGFDCAVASLGTSLTEEHAALLSRYTEQVYLIYDADEAGQRAAQRAIPMLEKAGLSIKVLQLKDAKDPDEYLKKFGADKFKNLLNESSNRVEYQLNAIRKKYDLKVDEEKVKFISEAADFISTLGNAVQREIYGTRVAEAAGISFDAMKIEINKSYKRRQTREKKKQERINLSPAANLQPKSRSIHYDNLKSARAEETVITQVLRVPALLEQTTQLQGAVFSSPLLGKVYDQLVLRYRQGLDVSLTGLSDVTAEEMSHIAGLVHSQQGPVSEQALSDCVNTILAEHDKKNVTSADDLLLVREQMKKRKGIKG